MYIFFLAGRFTFVRPVSYLAMVAIGLGVMALIVVVSIMNGFLAETRAFLRGTTADIVVTPLHSHRSRVAPGMTSADLLPIPREEIEAVVNGHPSVQGAAVRLVRPAVFKIHGRPMQLLDTTNGAGLTQVLVLGVEPDVEAEVSGFRDYLEVVGDSFLRVEDPADPFELPRSRIRDPRLRMANLPTVLMSRDLMLRLGLSKGDAVELVTVPDTIDLGSDQIAKTSQTFVLSGAFDTGHHTFDEKHVFVDRGAFLTWTNVAHGVSELYVKLDPQADFDVVRDELREGFLRQRLPAVVETWRDRHAIWLNAVENERTILFVIFGFFLLLVCTITYSVLTMMVQGKTRDIGILSAMGAPTGGVGRIFGTCGAYIATFGGIFGLVAGTLLAQNINAVKDFLEDTFGIEIFRKDVYAFTDIPVELSHQLDLLIAAATIVGAVVICQIPAWRAARMDPVEALRHE